MSKSISIKFIICTILITIVSATFCLPTSHALGNIFSDGKSFLQHGDDISETLETGKLEGTSDYIYNILLGIGIMVAVIIGMILGIQFMAASAGEKAKVKEALIPYVIGCIVVFGSFTIWKIVVNIGNDAESSISSSGTSSSPTPGLKGYRCNYCGKNISSIPAGVITGGRDFNCPNCGKQIVDGGTITGATEVN